MTRARWLGLAALLATAPAAAKAQRYFGQNQVEYRHFKWRVIETEHFLVHYYPEERIPAHDAAMMAERSYSRLSRIFGHQFREKKPIMLFASRADFGQNNVTGDLGEGTGGVTDAVRQRMILPFTGDYASFEHVLAHEMVHQFQYDIFARGKAGANLQTLESVNPPLWFMEGMAEYLTLGPNHVLTSTWVRNAVVNGNLPTIKQMTERPDKYFPYRYGEALWRYVGERWGDAAIGEIMQSVTNGGIERGIQRELGITLEQLSDQWREATRAEYLPRVGEMQRVRDFAQPMLTSQRSGPSDYFLGPVLSPDGQTVAFLASGSMKRGEVFIDLYLGDARTGKRLKRLVKSTTNPSFEELRFLYSQGSFSPDSRSFAFTAQTGGRDVLSIADVRTGRVRQLKDLPLDGVLSPSFSPDGQWIVFSGVTGGLTDLYVVDVNGKRLRALTHDRYGDMHPAWSPDGTRIAFATDRASTKLENLTLGKLQIAVVNVDGGTVTVLPGQAGLNINPVWSPDGRSLAYISDRSGKPDIYVRDLGADRDMRLTNVQGGVNAITEYSPALTWSRGTDRLAFTYYDNNQYTVWSLDHPRALAVANAAKAAQPLVASRPDSQPAGAVGVTPRGGAPVRPADTAVAAREHRSTYRGAGGTRPSERLGAGDASGDSTGVSSVATMLANPNEGLPDTLTFKEQPYAVHFTPDYISGGSVGVAGGGGYGTMFGGSTTIVLSDLTNDHQLAVGAGVYGRLQDASLLLGYADLSHRLQYSGGVSQDVAYVNTDAFQTLIDPQTQHFRDTYRYVRYVLRTAAASTEYPLNRFTRFELAAQASSIGRTVVEQTYDYSPLSVGVDYNQNTVDRLKTLTYLSPLAAFVSDNSLMGMTGPISGRRMRLSVAPAFGNIRWVEYLADYRRYDPIIFNTLTLATRVLGHSTVGKDEALFPQYIGRPDMVRGYDRSSIFGGGYECDTFLGAENSFGQACSTASLVGTRVAVFNEELRFPLIRRFDLGSLPIGLPPVDGLLFFDAGLAWNRGQKVSWSRPENYDADLQRFVMRSYGVGLRVNLFNLAILKWDYARPIDREANNKWNWTFSLGQSF